MTLGRKIRRLRTDRGIRRRPFATHPGIPAWAVTELEHDRRMPGARRLRVIARALGVPVDFLLDEEAPWPAPPARSEQSGDPEDGHPPNQPGTQDTVRMPVPREEKACLEALRKQPRSVGLLCRSVFTATPEALLLAWRLINLRARPHYRPLASAAPPPAGQSSRDPTATPPALRSPSASRPPRP